MTANHRPNHKSLKEQIKSRYKSGEGARSPFLDDPIKDAFIQLMQQQRTIVFGLGKEGELIYLEGAVEAITGYSQEDFLQLSRTWGDLVFPEDQIKFSDYRRQVNTSWEYRIINRNGNVCWLREITMSLLYSLHDITQLGIIVEITAQKQIEQKYMQRQAQLDSILNSVQDVIWSITPDTFKLIYANPATLKVYGYRQEDLLAGKYPDFSCQQAEMILDHYTELLYKGEFAAEYSYTRPDGEQCWLQKRAYFARDTYGMVARIDGIDADITMRKKAQDELRYMSEHDALTNLYNRAYFEKEIERLDLEKDRLAGLIICDVDGLKLVNDTSGHDTGDKLLIQCASILRACFPHNTIARIGGDEFAVIMENYTLEEVASAVTNINRAMLIFNRKQEKFPVSMSVGWSVRSAGCSRMHEVFREADNRMYAGKPANRLKFARLFGEVNKSK